VAWQDRVPLRSVSDPEALGILSVRPGFFFFRDACSMVIHCSRMQSSAAPQCLILRVDRISINVNIDFDATSGVFQGLFFYAAVRAKI
jgi:hypothetical protein